MINFPFVSGKNLKEGFEPSRRGKTKNALSLNSETKRLKTLCGTTLLAVSLAGHGPSRLPTQADGITPVTRPRLLASSFSRRLQGDFHRRACPPRTKRRLSSQAFGRILFLFFANYSITGLSYHILTVCQLIYAEKAAEFDAFSTHILLIPVQLGGVAVDAAEKHIPVPELHKLGPGLLMKGQHTALGIHPQLPDRLSGHCILHSEVLLSDTHFSFQGTLLIRRFTRRFCCMILKKFSENFFRPAGAGPPGR